MDREIAFLTFNVTKVCTLNLKSIALALQTIKLASLKHLTSIMTDLVAP